MYGATQNSDHPDQILSDLGTELRRLAERAPAEQDFERFEGELHQLFATAERAMLALELEQLDGKYSVYRCGISGHNRNGVLRNEVWEDSGEVRKAARRHAGAR